MTTKVIHLRSQDPRQHIAICGVDVAPSREWMVAELAKNGDDIRTVSENWPHSITKYREHATCPACLYRTE